MQQNPLPASLPEYRERQKCASFVLWIVLPFVVAAPLRADIDEPQFRTDLQALCGPSSRIVGSDGYYAAVKYVQQQVESLPNVELRRHEYAVTVPVTQSAALSLPDGSIEPVYPFWPALVRVCSTPADGIKGRLIYCGTCAPEEIRPADLHGQIAVIEASAGERWAQASYFGARAILVLGSNDTSHVDLRPHDVLVPVNIPRFYVPPGPLNDRLRAGQVGGEATLRARVTWETRSAVNLYAYVAPRVARIEGWTDPQPPGALMISVPLDASGLVPDLAVGASQAVQAACGLALLRDLSREPLDRPVVVFFGGADSIQMLATRQMLLALAESPARWDDEIAKVSTKLRDEREQLRRVREIESSPEQLDARRDRALLARVAQIIETDAVIEQDQLFRLRMAAQRSGDDESGRASLEARQVQLNQLRFTFRQDPSRLAAPDARDLAQQYTRRTIERLQTLIAQHDSRERELMQRQDLYRWLAGRVGRNASPSKDASNERPIELLVALDLSDRGVRCGPMFFGQFHRMPAIAEIQDYRDWFARTSRAHQQGALDVKWWGDVSRVMDFEPLNQSRAPQSFLGASLPIGSELPPLWGVPAFSILTLDDLRLRRDTPTDTLANLNVEAILPQLRATRTLLWRAWDDPAFKGPVERKRQRNQVSGQVVSAAPGRPIPDLPREGFLVTYFYTTNNTKKIPQPRALAWTLGVRRNEVRPCDGEGYWQIEALPRTAPDLIKDLFMAVEVFRIDPASGAIVAATDLGRQSTDSRPYIDLRVELVPMRSLAFNCEEFSLVGVYDPRFLQPLNEVIPLDARRNAEPQRFNVVLSNQLLAGFVEPASRTQLVLRYGRVGNRMLLLNMQGANPAPSPSTPGEGGGEGLSASVQQMHPLPSPLPEYREREQSSTGRGAGLGLTVRQFASIGPLALVTARDFWRLDELRLREYRRAGVSSSLVDSLHATAETQLARAQENYAKNRGGDFVRDAAGAWANEARVYAAAEDMARDVVRGAIFLLILCVPFAFVMERLLVATPDIYKQIAGSAVIFALMTAALWAFHPAFRISSSPLIIILAFAIIFMSGVVIAVVYGRFDTELKKLRSGRAGTTTMTAGGASFARASVAPASFARASVLTSALSLGIANMRRRKFRTALTSVTIVLITFTVLCFTSATRYLDTTTLPAGVETAHPGVMLRQRGMRPMPASLLDSLRPVLASVLGRDVPVVERWWVVNAKEPREMVNLVAPAREEEPARVIALSGLLGLSAGESNLSHIEDVIGPERFARLETGESSVIYLAKPTSEELGVAEGDTILVGGIPLEVAGTYDPDQFDRLVTTLSGAPAGPLRYTTGALDAGGRKMEDAEAESFALDAGASAAELSGSYQSLSSSQYAIVPARVARMFPNGTLRSVGIGLENQSEVERVSDELARRYSLALFAGYDDGVRLVSASNLASVSGAGQVAIPLAIGALIIFNTMMGSIAERRREIHVYTSLGLAPLHVGALFVAEAMTYGLIGTVFGYVIGQGAGTALSKLGWLGSVTLNYSGTSAILTMSLILLIVLLSALVPARLASKLAAPSIERSWRVPEPEGDVIRADLPFTINKTAADGALAYLAEFFDAHQEGSIGKFSAAPVEAFTHVAGERFAHGLRTTVWLTPFDLGVRQHFQLLIQQGEFEDIYEVKVILTRLSGDDASWYRMNRTFLTELRKQFLQWRSLSRAKMLEYVEQSRQLFAKDAPLESLA